MLIQFVVTRRDDKVIGVVTDSKEFKDVTPKLPLVTTSKITVSKYSIPPHGADHFRKLLIKQM